MAPRPAENHPLHKLTWSAVRAIRLAHANHTPVRALARTYRVDPHTVRDIIYHRTWLDPLDPTSPQVRVCEPVGVQPTKSKE
jgi:hypothetical protein